MKNDRIEINGTMRTRGRAKQTWIKTCKKNMLVVDLTKEMTVNRAEWKKGYMSSKFGINTLLLLKQRRWPLIEVNGEK